MTIPVRQLFRLLAVSFVLHEAEEWNIASWEHAHFTPPPRFDDFAARTLLGLFSILCVSFTALALRFLTPRNAAIALLPLFVAVVFGNALTHIFWLFYFGSYAPGVVTAAFLLVPLTLHLVHRVLREDLAPRLYVWVLLALAAVQPLGAALAGSTLSESQLALQSLCMRLSQWIWSTGLAGWSER